MGTPGVGPGVPYLMSSYRDATVAVVMLAIWTCA
jgi:hypothetical protein